MATPAEDLSASPGGPMANGMAGREVGPSEKKRKLSHPQRFRSSSPSALKIAKDSSSPPSPQEGAMSPPARIEPEQRQRSTDMLKSQMARDLLWRHKLVIVLVGLPARGKSFLGSKVVGFLQWQGISAKSFNAGAYRREMMAGQKQDASFFGTVSSETKTTCTLEELAMTALGHLLDWLQEGGDVAVFDATNSTKARRRAVLQKCAERSSRLPVLFVESICRNPEQLQANLIEKVRYSPDYRDMPLEAALSDLRTRIKHYEERYQTIGDDEDSIVNYIKVMDTFSHVVCNRIQGRLQNLCAQYFMSIHLQPRAIYLVRAGSHTITSRPKLKLSALPKPRFVGSPGVAFPLPLSRTLASHMTPLDEPGSISPQRDSSLSISISAPSRAVSSPVSSVLYSPRLPASNCASCDHPIITPGTFLTQDDVSQSVVGSSACGLTDTGTRFCEWLGAFMLKETTRRERTTTTSTASSSTSHCSSASDPVSFSSSGESSSASDSPSKSRWPDAPLQIFCSPLARAVQTAEPVLRCLPGAEMREEMSLRMLDTGLFHGLTLDEIKTAYPHEFHAWQADKFHYRYPGGESQRDLAGQLLPVILELERQAQAVMVVSHLSTLQVLYGYFLGIEVDPHQYWNLTIPQHTVIRLTPHHYGWVETRFSYNETVNAGGRIQYRVTEDEVAHSTKFYK
eukprot:gb/GEZN01002627.1/.p1 GENE.gb/GEZN01002627.1/~~gb/GEZN01002627.1/.p1  ORF type:complete len:682 (+),score=115.86 gb/GEZN01002627.1/:112-2157(+)